MRICENCIHQWGTECRRYPPRPIVYTFNSGLDSEIRSEWPTVSNNDSCGEFESESIENED